VTDPWASPGQPGPARPTPATVPAGRAGRTPEKDSSLLVKIKKLFRDPLSIVLVVVIVIALVAAGLLAGELYARSRADSIVARAAQCVVQDSATVSFGPLPPFLMQHISGHYTNIHFETAGNQIRQAKGMKVNVVIRTSGSRTPRTPVWSIGSLVANVTWSSQGIKDTIQNAIPLVGAFRHRRDDEPVCRHHRAAGGAGQHRRQAGGRRQRDLAAGDGADRPRFSRCRGRPCSLRWTRSPRTLTKNYPLGIHADNRSGHG